MGARSPRFLHGGEPAHSCSGRGTERKSVPSGEAAAPALLSSDPREATRAALPEGHPPFLLFLHAIECFLCCAKLLPLVSSRWSVFAFVACLSMSHPKTCYQDQRRGASAPPPFSPPTVSGLTAKPLIRVDVLFACGVRGGSGFTLLHVGVFPVCTGETRRFQ